MVIQPKDVLALPLPDEISSHVAGTMLRVLRTTVTLLWQRFGDRLNDEDQTDLFTVMVTALVAQAEAVNLMVDMVLEPGSVPMSKVSPAVREAIRQRVRDVFRGVLDA